MKPSRVHPIEWLTGLFGLVMIAGLLMPWSEGRAALASPGPLDLLLLLAAVAAVLLPVAVAASARTNVPIVYETTLWTVSLLLGLVMLVRMLFPPQSGFGSGFWLLLTATIAMSFTAWKSVGRER